VIRRLEQSALWLLFNDINSSAPARVMRAGLEFGYSPIPEGDSFEVSEMGTPHAGHCTRIVGTFLQAETH
jgi:hypothetical protein